MVSDRSSRRRARRAERKSARISRREVRKESRSSKKASRRAFRLEKRRQRSSTRLEKKTLKLEQRSGRQVQRQGSRRIKQAQRLASREQRQDSSLIFRERRLQTRKRAKALRQGTSGVSLTAIPERLIQGSPFDIQQDLPPFATSTFDSVSPALEANGSIIGSPQIQGDPKEGFFDDLTGAQKLGGSLGTVALIGGGLLAAAIIFKK